MYVSDILINQSYVLSVKYPMELVDHHDECTVIPHNLVQNPCGSYFLLCGHFSTVNVLLPAWPDPFPVPSCSLPAGCHPKRASSLSFRKPQ